MTPSAGDEPPDVPVEPIRRQHFKIITSMDPWHLEPCRDDDPRPGGLLLDVDAYGRPVSPIYDMPWDDRTLLGWQLVPRTGVDPAEVVAFIEAEAARRRHTSADRARGRER
jgi:hypothetical protein